MLLRGYLVLGIMDKVNGMLGKFSNRVVAGRGAEEAQAPQYAPAMQNAAYPEEERQPQAAPERPVYDNPFRGDGENDYGGRTVYVSKRDRELQQQQASQQQMQQTGQFAPVQQMQPSARFAPVPQRNPQGQPPQPPQPAQQAARPNPQQAPQPQQQPVFSQNAPAGNVLPFPGSQQRPEAPVYSHVEYVLFLHGYNQSRNIIDFIKTNASVFLNMEFIASEGERQRCVDFLSGAVYALGCTLSRISPRGIYLISAPTVQVILDPYAQRLAKAPEVRGYVQQRYDQSERRPAGDAHQQYPQQGQPQRQPMQQRPQMQDYAQMPQQPQAPLREREAVYQNVSPTNRFASVGTQRNQPVTYASAMGAGNGGYGDRKHTN